MKSRIQVPLTKIWNPIPRIQGVESRIQDCPGFPFSRARNMVPKSPLGITSPFSLVFENVEQFSFKISRWGFRPPEVYCPYFHIPQFKDF